MVNRSKGPTGDNLHISRVTPEIASFNDSVFLDTRVKIWLLYLPSAPKIAGKEIQGFTSSQT